MLCGAVDTTFITTPYSNAAHSMLQAWTSAQKKSASVATPLITKSYRNVGRYPVAIW